MTVTGPRAKTAFVSEPGDPISELSFEDALKRLEEIVQLLEGGQAPLDKAIDLYSEGDRLKRQCEARLAAAQARVEQITLTSDGRATGTRDFDAG